MARGSSAGGAAAPLVVPVDKVVGTLILDLGAERYAARERATEALRRIGSPAASALEKAADSDDPEVRLRARDVLSDVRLGVGPDCPSEIILLIRHYGRLAEQERQNALQRVATSLGARAVPFLVLRLASGNEGEANLALNLLQRMNNDEVRRQVAGLINQPANDYQARALAWARARGGLGIESLESMVRGQIQDDAREKTLAAGVQDILAKLKDGKRQEAADAAEKLAKAEPNEPRFLYLQAEALAAMDKDKQAAALRERAPTLSADKQEPHYRAAELLGRLGRRRLAAREWERILEIEPKDSICDLNACVSLGVIYAANGLFEQAAQYLEKAIERFAKDEEEENGKKVAPGTIEGLHRELGRLRSKAARYPAPPDAAIEDAPPDGEVGVSLQVGLKEGKLEDLQRALASVAAQLHVAVQPADLDLNIFDLPSTSLRYDAARKQLLILLHDTPACEPFPIDPKSGEFRVAVHSSNFTYLFGIDAAGKAERIAQFEKNYLVALRPGVRANSLTDVSLRINEAAYEWDKALKGVPMDRLPDELEIVVEGTTPQGRRSTVRAKVKVTESMVRPLAP